MSSSNRMGRPRKAKNVERRTVGLGKSEWRTLRRLAKVSSITSWTDCVRTLLDVVKSMELVDGLVWCDVHGEVHREESDPYGNPNACAPDNWQTLYSLGQEAPASWKVTK